MNKFKNQQFFCILITFIFLKSFHKSYLNVECANELKSVDPVDISNLINMLDNCFIRVNLFGEISINYVSINQPIVLHNFERLRPYETKYHKKGFILQKFQATFDFTFFLVSSPESVLRFNNKRIVGWFKDEYTIASSYNYKLSHARLNSYHGFLVTEKQFQKQMRFYKKFPTWKQEEEIYEDWTRNQKDESHGEHKKKSRKEASSSEPFLLFISHHINIHFIQHLFIITLKTIWK